MGPGILPETTVSKHNPPCHQSGKVFYDQKSPNLTFLLEITDAVSSGPKRRETFQRSVQRPACLRIWWCIRYGQLECFGRYYECWNVYKGFRATYAPLQMTSISAGQCKPHTAAITKAWLRSRRVRVLNWPVCSPDLSPIENICSIIIWKICQRRPQTLQQLEIYFRQEWDQIPTLKLQKLITLMPRCLQTVLKRRGDAMVNMPLSQLFWDL